MGLEKPDTSCSVAKRLGSDMAEQLLILAVAPFHGTNMISLVHSSVPVLDVHASGSDEVLWVSL